jgi:hypothetical protein
MKGKGLILELPDFQPPFIGLNPFEFSTPFLGLDPFRFEILSPSPTSKALGKNLQCIWRAPYYSSISFLKKWEGYYAYSIVGGSLHI